MQVAVLVRVTQQMEPQRLVVEQSIPLELPTQAAVQAAVMVQTVVQV
jgi:hypothetical protein